jgi:hypothetical protein
MRFIAPSCLRRAHSTNSCALRSDDTDARKATVARFGRSHRSAPANQGSSPGSGRDGANGGWDAPRPWADDVPRLTRLLLRLEPLLNARHLPMGVGTLGRSLARLREPPRMPDGQSPRGYARAQGVHSGPEVLPLLTLGFGGQVDSGGPRTLPRARSSFQRSSALATSCLASQASGQERGTARAGGCVRRRRRERGGLNAGRYFLVENLVDWPSMPDRS